MLGIKSLAAMYIKNPAEIASSMSILISVFWPIRKKTVAETVVARALRILANMTFLRDKPLLSNSPKSPISCGIS